MPVCTSMSELYLPNVFLQRGKGKFTEIHCACTAMCRLASLYTATKIEEVWFGAMLDHILEVAGSSYTLLLTLLSTCLGVSSRVLSPVTLYRALLRLSLHVLLSAADHRRCPWRLPIVNRIASAAFGRVIIIRAYTLPGCSTTVQIGKKGCCRRAKKRPRWWSTK